MCLAGEVERSSDCRSARDPPKRANAEQHHAATPNLRGCVRATHHGAKGVAEGLCEVLVRVGPSSVTLKSDLEITLKTTTAAAAIFKAITRDLAHGWKGGVESAVEARCPLRSKKGVLKRRAG